MKFKSIFLTAAATIGLTAATMAQVPNYVPTNGLVGYWPFNGNANDESGNNFNGSVNGAVATLDRFGAANSAYSFNGVSNRIEVANNSTINNLTQVSISYWVNVNQLPQSNVANGFAGCVTKWFGTGNCNSNTDHYGSWITSNSTFKGGTRLYPAGANMTSSQPIITLGNWFFVCFIHDASVGGSLYINGNLVSQIPISGNLCSTTNNLYFGCDNGLGTLNRFLNGKLDDIGIWNRALTECEIKDLYNAQLGSFSNTTLIVNPTSSSIGTNAILTVSSPISSLQWQSNPSNVGWVNLSNNTQYNGVTNDTLVVSNLQLSNHNQPFRVLACGDTSNLATIQIADTCITNVTIYDTLLTTVTDTLVINTQITGVNPPNNLNTIKVFPNPANDHITINYGNFATMSGYTLKITNNLGQVVFTTPINQQSSYIDLSTMSGNGIYFVQIIDTQNNTIENRKIVIQ
jgi:hypothetical protein